MMITMMIKKTLKNNWQSARKPSLTSSFDNAKSQHLCDADGSFSTKQYLIGSNSIGEAMIIQTK